MEGIDVGWLSLLPPIIAIGLALLTKEVISSLVAGILSGAIIYTVVGGFHPMAVIDTTFGVMINKMGENASILLFLALLGALVAVITKAGGSQAYGKWASSKIKSRRGAQLSTALLGLVIFIDDYFNCLTVGTVMRPVTDKNRVSRAKLAYLIDSTAAPICIIAPISSWAATVAGTMAGSGIEDGMSMFISTIPYNLYALLTILMVFLLSVKRLDFGPMARFEQNAIEYGDLHSSKNNTSSDIAKDDFDGMEISTKGKVYDLILPILALIVFTVLAMLYTGGLFSGGASNIAEAFGNCDPFTSLVYGGFGGLIFALLLFVPRKVISFKSFMSGLTDGFKSMIPADTILILAWTISGLCRDQLLAGEFVGEFVKSSQLPLMILPVIIFIIAALMSFALGTSWGTFMMLIPIVIIIVGADNTSLLTPVLAATLAGSVFGDHCSPISDSTIMSSTGAGCSHMDHVSTQIPYAVLVACCCVVGFVVAGFTQNIWLTLATALLCFLIAIFILHRLSDRHMKKVMVVDAEELTKEKGAVNS